MTRMTKKERQRRVQRLNRLEKGFKAFEQGTNVLVATLRENNDPILAGVNDRYFDLHARYRLELRRAEHAVDEANRALEDQ